MSWNEWIFITGNQLIPRHGIPYICGIESGPVPVLMQPLQLANNQISIKSVLLFENEKSINLSESIFISFEANLPIRIIQ